MSADLLREAAALLRQRAEAAAPAPWKSDNSVKGDSVVWDRDGEWLTNIEGRRVVRLGVVAFDQAPANSDYIATMHPGVGLALADWLEAEVDLAADPRNHAEVLREALAVANAILGRQS